MFSWFRRLLPVEERFFEMFARHAATVERGAEELQAMLAGGEAVARHYPQVLAAEDSADAITREVTQAVRRSFVTPFDRGDIQSLIGAMDDTIDQMKKAAKTIMLFEVRDFDPELRQMADAILRCARLQREVLPLMERITSNANRITELCEQIRHVEEEADDIHDIGVTELFRRSAQDQALRFIVAREIFDQLEKVVDRFDDVASTVENIVVEHV